MIRPASGAMTISSPSGAGVTTPVAWMTARIDPTVASSTLTGAGASLSVSSAAGLLHAAVANVPTTTPNTNHLLRASVAREFEFNAGSGIMAAELQWRARDRRARSVIDRWHPANAAGRHALPAAPEGGPR